MSKCMNPSHPCNELRKKGHKGAAVIPFNYNSVLMIKIKEGLVNIKNLIASRTLLFLYFI